MVLGRVSPHCTEMSPGDALIYLIPLCSDGDENDDDNGDAYVQMALHNYVCLSIVFF